MALNTSKCNYLTPLPSKGLTFFSHLFWGFTTSNTEDTYRQRWEWPKFQYLGSTSSTGRYRPGCSRQSSSCTRSLRWRSNIEEPRSAIAPLHSWTTWPACWASTVCTTALPCHVQALLLPSAALSAPLDVLQPQRTLYLITYDGWRIFLLYYLDILKLDKSKILCISLFGFV